MVSKTSEMSSNPKESQAQPEPASSDLKWPSTWSWPKDLVQSTDSPDIVAGVDEQALVLRECSGEGRAQDCCDEDLDVATECVEDDVANEAVVVYRTAAPASEPAWAAKRVRNYETSWLYRIPPEVLLRILELADGNTRQVLWSTSSLLMRLVSCSWDLKVNTLKPRATKASSVGPANAVWPFYGDDDERSENQEVLRRLLHRDQAAHLCTPCSEFRKKGQLPDYLDWPTKIGHFPPWVPLSGWCTRCRFSHETPCVDSRRGVFWTALESHCTKCNVAHPLAFFTNKSSNRRGKNKQPKPLECVGWTGKVNICRHRALTWSELQHLVKRTKRNKGHSELDAMKTLGASCHCVKGKEQSLPIVQARFSEDLQTLSVSSRTPAFELDPDMPISRDSIRDWMTSAQKQNTLKGIMCPHLTLDDGQLLLPFEQNHCVCFDHPTSLAADGHLSIRSHMICQSTTEKADPCCRCRAINLNNPELAGQFMPLNQTTPTPTPTSASDSMLPSTGHNYECTTCSMMYSWVRDNGDPEHGRPARVYLQTKVDIALQMAKPAEGRRHRGIGGGQWVQTWLKHADPKAWGIKNNQGFKHVFWCDDGECMTGSRWTRLMQYLRDEECDY